MNRLFLVTGAAGFLGAFFVSHLLRSGHRVRALVRPGSGPNLQRALERIATGDVRTGTLEIAEGDVRLPRCGLAVSRAAAAADPVTDVWHFAAAFESTGRGDRAVFETNVEGTANVLDLAALSGAPVRFNLISTAYCSPVSGAVAYERLSDPADRKENAYERSKAEAERRASTLAAAHGMELAILRPSIVIGDSETGVSLGYSGYQGVLRALFLLKRRLQVNLGPDYDANLGLRVDAAPDLALNLIPVDFAVEAMWRAAETGGGERIVHITHDSGATLDALFRYGADALDIHGITLSECHDYQSHPPTIAERLFHRRVQFQAPYLLRHLAFDTENFRHAAAADGPAAPPVDAALMARCNGYLVAEMEAEFGLGGVSTAATA